jgi:hypothetical protein
MKPSSRLRRTAGALLLALAMPAGASAQNATVPDEVFNRVWAQVRDEFARELEQTPAPERQALFVRMLDRVISHEEIVSARNTPAYRKALLTLVSELPDSSLAQSVNAPLTNPGSNQILERSGFSDLLALAADARKLFSADDSAVSINLNAVALLGGGKGGNDRSAPYLYARNEQWRRVGGTFTFGGKVPEKEITGITGVPSANTLLDAVAWDVKVRVVGDRDPRASRWYPLLAGELGGDLELAARVLTAPGVDVADIGALRAAANTVVGRQLTVARREVEQSLQISVKFAGQHITEQRGKNRYSGALMLDTGFGPGLDATANLSFSAADAPRTALGLPVRTKEWQFAAGLTGSVLKDALAPGRAVELTAAASGKVPVDDLATPMNRKRVLQANVSLAVPFQAKAKIPISVTYSNDPNNLVKQNIVSGQIGLSYDFGAIWGALKP